MTKPTETQHTILAQRLAKAQARIEALERENERLRALVGKDSADILAKASKLDVQHDRIARLEQALERIKNLAWDEPHNETCDVIYHHAASALEPAPKPDRQHGAEATRDA